MTASTSLVMRVLRHTCLSNLVRQGEDLVMSPKSLGT